MTLTADGIPFKIGMTVYKVEGSFDSCDVRIIPVNTDATGRSYALTIKDDFGFGHSVYQIPLGQTQRKQRSRWIHCFAIKSVYADKKNALREKIAWMQDHIDEIIEQIAEVEKEIASVEND